MTSERELRISSSCRIDKSELHWRTSRSGGPGGQHANTSDTKVEVSFNAADSPSLGPRQRMRIVTKLGPVVRAHASDSRSQAQNRITALNRLSKRIATALQIDPPRRPSRPSRAAKKSRLDEKRKHSRKKTQRRRPDAADE
ncbi:MAG: aminoacyl-tRNA hydrolase [Actinobacteria bacterium]|nr:aminoacyl-tRNA hydrolase [Acidimicrobiia bacterium]MSO17244.1 aminoacyl-tRNA hydrolase [Acidimicrobiia bacterium]PHX59826.1 MAG: aminoacyl-tRNA hydrolase [Actinomycetota bacterium]